MREQKYPENHQILKNSGLKIAIEIYVSIFLVIFSCINFSEKKICLVLLYIDRL